MTNIYDNRKVAAENMMLTILLSLLLTFSFKLVQLLLQIGKLNKKFTVIYWAIFIIAISPFFTDSYIYQLPKQMDSVLPVFLLICAVGIVISRFSGYYPIGKFDYIHFVFTYPIIEEIIFRGLILPCTSIYVDSTPIGQIMYLPLTFSVLISAFLFAICHLQYYHWSAQCLRFMIIAFCGGIFYGALANVTESIVLTCILHIVFNYFSVFFSVRRAKT